MVSFSQIFVLIIKTVISETSNMFLLKFNAFMMLHLNATLVYDIYLLTLF